MEPALGIPMICYLRSNESVFTSRPGCFAWRIWGYVALAELSLTQSPRRQGSQYDFPWGASASQPQAQQHLPIITRYRRIEDLGTRRGKVWWWCRISGFVVESESFRMMLPPWVLIKGESIMESIRFSLGDSDFRAIFIYLQNAQQLYNFKALKSNSLARYEQSRCLHIAKMLTSYIRAHEGFDFYRKI